MWIVFNEDLIGIQVFSKILMQSQHIISVWTSLVDFIIYVANHLVTGIYKSKTPTIEMVLYKKMSLLEVWIVTRVLTYDCRVVSLVVSITYFKSSSPNRLIVYSQGPAIWLDIRHIQANNCGFYNNRDTVISDC